MSRAVYKNNKQRSNVKELEKGFKGENGMKLTLQRCKSWFTA